MAVRKMDIVGIAGNVEVDLALEVSGLTLTLRAGTFCCGQQYTLAEDQVVTFDEVLADGFPHIVNCYLVEHKDTYAVALFVEEVSTYDPGDGSQAYSGYYDWSAPANVYRQLFPATINFVLEPHQTDLAAVEIRYYNYVIPQG